MQYLEVTLIGTPKRKDMNGNKIISFTITEGLRRAKIKPLNYSQVTRV
jgi:hypothetical protein